MKNHGDQPFQYSLRSLQYSSSDAASAAWSPHPWQASSLSPNLEYYSFWIFVKIKVISFLPGYFFTTLGAMSIIQVKLAIVKMNNDNNDDDGADDYHDCDDSIGMEPMMMMSRIITLTMLIQLTLASCLVQCVLFLALWSLARFSFLSTTPFLSSYLITSSSTPPLWYPYGSQDPYKGQVRPFFKGIPSTKKTLLQLHW